MTGKRDNKEIYAVVVRIRPRIRNNEDIKIMKRL